MDREEAEKRFPLKYEDAMKNTIIAGTINSISLWGKLIELGFVKDFNEVEEYQKKVYECALREQMIKRLTEEQ